MSRIAQSSPLESVAKPPERVGHSERRGMGAGRRPPVATLTVAPREVRDAPVRWRTPESGLSRASPACATSLAEVPVRSIEDWQQDVERYLSHFARHGKRPTVIFTPHSRTTPVWTPAVDIYETADSLVVLLDLAGIDPHETEVRAEPGQLVVRGARRERRRGGGDQPAQRTYHALEIPYGQFERILRLPAGLNTEEARASYHDGLLEVVLPRRSPTQVKITIAAGDSEETP